MPGIYGEPARLADVWKGFHGVELLLFQPSFRSERIFRLTYNNTVPFEGSLKGELPTSSAILALN